MTGWALHSVVHPRTLQYLRSNDSIAILPELQLHCFLVGLFGDLTTKGIS